MKSLTEYVLESQKEDIASNVKDMIVDELWEYVDEEKCDKPHCDGKDIYVENVLIGLDPETYEYKISTDKKELEKFAVILDPKELTCVEHEMFVTDELEKAIVDAIAK